MYLQDIPSTQYPAGKCDCSGQTVPCSLLTFGIIAYYVLKYPLKYTMQLHILDTKDILTTSSAKPILQRLTWMMNALYHQNRSTLKIPGWFNDGGE